MVMRNRRYQEIEKGYSRLDSKAAMRRILTEDLDGRDGPGGPRADDRGVREILRDKKMLLDWYFLTERGRRMTVVTVTNRTPGSLVINKFFGTLGRFQSVTKDLTVEELEASRTALVAQEAAGNITWEVTKTATVADDKAEFLPVSLVALPVFANATRPDPTTLPVGSTIFNTDDGTTNISDGTNWLDPTGAIT